MGSTSETYENGTNIVVYVANENAHIHSHQHHYHSHNIVSGNVHSINDNDAVYNVCSEYGPSSVTVTNYEIASSPTLTPIAATAAEKSAPFDISDQNDNHDNCAINGGSMHDSNNLDSYNYDNPYSASGHAHAEPAIFVNEKLNDQTVNFVSAQEAFVRCESVRSVDSVTSGCSSLSSSSVGNSKNLSNESFAVTTATCASSDVNFTAKDSVTFPSYPVIPFPNKDTGSTFQKPTVSIPFGWKRLLSNGSIIYISPNNTVLNSLEQVNSYLLTDGNCFCGLDCPLFSHTVFNFDPEVVTSPVPTSPAGLSKLCNHKRKRNVSNIIPSSNLQNQSYDNISHSHTPENRHLESNYCNPAIIKKHAFDVSDRRKRRKIMPDQLYVNDEISVPSPNVMVHDDCDISAKENNTTVISPMSQVENNIYNHKLGMAVGMSEQHMTDSMGSSVRLKTPSFNHGFHNQSTYYNSRTQNYGYNIQNECFPVNSYHSRPMQEQNNVYTQQDEFSGNQNNSNYVCNQVKSNGPHQQSCGNSAMNQHHHLNCSIISQQHRISCNDNGSISPHHHINSPQQQPYLPVISQQFQHQQHHALSQQSANFQQMRVIQNHSNGSSLHPPIALNGSINSQMVDNKFIKQAQHTFLNQEKMDKPLYHHGQETNHACEMNMNACRIPKNGNSVCNCYHNDNPHSHLQHSTCLQECSNNCSQLMVQNSQNQIVMQQGHHIVNHDPNITRPIQSQQIHHQTGQHHSIHLQNQMQSPQLYSHHHHHIQQQQQQQQQQIHAHLHQQPHQQQHHHQQQQQQQQQQHQQQMHMMQIQNLPLPQNVEMKTNQNRCSNQIVRSQINNQMNLENEIITPNTHFGNQNHMGNLAQQRATATWQQKNILQTTNQNVSHCSEMPCPSQTPPNPFERVPPLHHHIPPPSPNWNEEPSRKKLMKNCNKSPTNLGAKKIKTTFNHSDTRSVTHTTMTSTTLKGKQEFSNTPVPSFMEDPSGYLAQQTALLNSTISKQIGENPTSTEQNTCFVQISNKQMASSTSNQNTMAIIKNETKSNINKNSLDEMKSRLPQAKTPDSSGQSDTSFNTHSPKIYRTNSISGSSSFVYKVQARQYEENPVTSSTYTDKDRNVSSSPSESRSPIQAGTVSTSNQSPIQPGMTSPNICNTPNTNNDASPQSPVVSKNIQGNDNITTESSRSNQQTIMVMTNGYTCSSNVKSPMLTGKSFAAVVPTNNTSQINNNNNNNNNNNSNIISNNTIATTINNKTVTCTSTTSTATVNNSNSNINNCSSSNNIHNNIGNNYQNNNNNHNSNNSLMTVSGNINEEEYNNSDSATNCVLSSSIPQIEQISKSPLEMVQNVVSSIQIPSHNMCSDIKTSVGQNSIQTSHFLVSNNGQLLVATSNNPQSIVSQQNLSSKVNSPLSVINNSTVVTNATGTVTQMIPAVSVTQQVLGQPTVLVNTLPSGQLVFQPSVMALDSAGNAVQIPQLAVATNNVVQSQTITDTGTISVATNGSFSPRGQSNLLSPESSKRKANGKKRKLSPQQMLQLTQQSTQNGNGTTSVVVQQPQTQQNFTQSTPMLQTLILPNKNGQFTNTQPLIATANVLQPLNLVHNIPTIQQFIVPAGLGGMVMTNGDGTATLLPETVQLNVLTPVQNTANTVFGHTTGQGILAASPATGMVIRTQPSTSQTAVNTQVRPQTISTPNGTQFIATQSPNQFIVNNSPTFNGQLSPIVANVSPNHHIHAFNTSPNATNITSRSTAAQEYLQCVNGSVNGQTLMVPCSMSQSTNPQNTTVVQQNTTIVQQQMTMVSNNQQLNENATAVTSNNTASNPTSNINLGQHNIILNDGKQSQNFIITTTDKSTGQPHSGYILSPKNGTATSHDKSHSTASNASGTHFILNNLNAEKQSQSFIISSSPSDKQLCSNFILTNTTSEKTTNARSNFIITGNHQTPTTSMDRQTSRFTKHSVSTQTAAAAAVAAAAAAAGANAANNQQLLQISSTPTLIVATNNTFSQTNSSYSASPPDTTTHSPVGTSGQSPDTPSSSIVVGSTDDVASPTSSTPVGADMQTRQPMVHCISSSNVVDWSESGFEDKKLNIIVDHGSSSEIITSIDMFPSLGSIQPHFQRRSSVDPKESISYIESSTFDESVLRK